MYSFLSRAVLFSLVVHSLAVHCVPATFAGDDFTVLPRVVSLTGPKASAGLIVQRVVTTDSHHSSTIAGQIHDGIQLKVADPRIARIENGRIFPVADGVTELEARVEGFLRTVRIPVSVRDSSVEPQYEFEAHIQAVFSRHGCNSGACHGALAGKGGFQLSLLGYDPSADHYSITTQELGRRIEPAEPLVSLLLTKPSMQVPHKGGLRLDPDSNDYQVLATWIASGAEGPRTEDSALVGIEVLPNAFQAEIGNPQSLIVRAHYQDGRIEDVTHWAKFNSSNEAVAEVDTDGNVSLVGHGRGAVVAWFASRLALAYIDVPFSNNRIETVDGSSGQSPETLAQSARDHDSANESLDSPTQFSPANIIDEILVQEWQALGLAPSPVCDDLTFLRRAYLDATGTIPQSQEVLELLASGLPLDRPGLVNRLLDSPQFIDYWTYQWSDLLLINGNLLRPKAVESFYKWIRSQVEENVPWDQFARSIVLAKGDSFKNGATNFYAIHQTPEAMTENTCLAFMGLSIECAKCHNHPLERWTNDQYYAMANLFARVRAKGWGGDARSGDGNRTLVVMERGDLIQPTRGKPQPPAPLDQPALDPDEPGDRREALAEWLTSNSNRYFSRAITNRVWANFMGVGLVEPVDDLRVSNPASSDRLLSELSQFLVEQDYDLKELMRLIMNSRVYQLSAEATEFNREDQRFYCRYFPRRLNAEVLHDAVVQVTNVPTAFDKIEFAGADKQPTEFYPEGTKALGLYDSAVSNYFLQTFGRHQRRITCDCERSIEPTVVQVLHLNNGDTLNDKLSHQDCIITQWMEQSLPMDQMIELSYIRALTRLPTESERQRIHEEFQLSQSDEVPLREFLEDLLWSLMSNSEFLFAH